MKENETFPLGMYEYLTVPLVPKQLLEGVHLLHPRATELGAAPHPPSRTTSTVVRNQDPFWFLDHWNPPKDGSSPTGGST